MNTTLLRRVPLAESAASERRPLFSSAVFVLPVACAAAIIYAHSTTMALETRVPTFTQTTSEVAGLMDTGVTDPGYHDAGDGLAPPVAAHR